MLIMCVWISSDCRLTFNGGGGVVGVDVTAAAAEFKLAEVSFR